MMSNGGSRRPQGIVQPVFPDLPQQRARADPQQLRGPLSIAPGLEQVLLDRLAFHVGQGSPLAGRTVTLPLSLAASWFSSEGRNDGSKTGPTVWSRACLRVLCSSRMLPGQE